jgi:hypothetical protein
MTSDIEYLLRTDQTVLEIHGDWDRFALENQAPELLARTVRGRKLTESVVDPETRLIYVALLKRVLETGEPIRFTYRCDSPDRARHMSMRIDPVGPDVLRFRSKLLREEPRDALALLDRDAARSRETLKMCGWCNRVNAAGDRWKEVEDHVAESGLLEATTMPLLNHGICPECALAMERLVESPA